MWRQDRGLVMKLQGKVALVTGGASGIGRATALLFAAEGAAVVVCDVDGNKGQEVVETIRQRGGRAEFVQADVSKAVDAERAVALATRVFGGLDCLVNNAGVCITGSTQDTEESVWDKVLSVNLKSVWLCAKYAIGAMRKRGKGAIVNIGSTASLVGLPDLAAYCASKGGVANLTRAMALDTARFGIRVNCVCPGHINTPLASGFVNAQADPQAFVQEFIVKSHPLGRMGEPEEVARAALFLCSDDSSFVTGAVLAVDGGYTAR
jgi:NAD(P)-dependent dehydrogenase (short-subunit alcohol dehydrogenase family)